MAASTSTAAATSTGIESKKMAAMPSAEAMMPKAPENALKLVSDGGLPKSCFLASVTDRPRTTAPQRT